MMRKRALIALAGASALIVAAPGTAWADINYTLSGKGAMKYVTDTDVLTIFDYKTGDNMYVNYKFTDDSCGSAGNACAPNNPGTIRRDSANVGSSAYTLSPGGRKYLVIRLCNDDAPPDTCSLWKRSAA